MGLAGRKQKQRISADPRNLSWADDASRFGHAYLSKFGWDTSQGLGSSGDGIKTHLKVQQKLDMMGIGAEHQRDPNGIAWKQNREFETLLKRLNESSEHEKGADGEDANRERGREREMGFVSAQEEKVSKDAASLATIGRRRKHKDTEASENTRKKQKKEKEKHRKSALDVSAPAMGPSSDASSVPPSLNPHSEPIPKPRPMAHRARIRAAKRITGKSASAISEILGIAPSSVSTSTPALQSSSLLLDNLTTSVKSVADYFVEKLLSRSTASSIPSSSTPSGSAAPGLGPGSSNISPLDDEDNPPRRGIGSRAPAVLPNGGGDADSRDTLPEKMRKKAERKAEKRKRREAEGNEPIPENVSTSVEERVERADAESDTVQRTSKEKKKKEHQKREQQAHGGKESNANDDGITVKQGRERDSSSLLEPNKISKKEHKKKHS